MTIGNDMTDHLTLLGVESTCDETAAAVVRVPLRAGMAQGPGQVLSSVVWGQVDLHAAFGGVVPEIAARAHAERADPCIRQAMQEAGLRFADLHGIAVASGPGLIGGVLAGVMVAKGLSYATGLPVLGVNHLAAHVLTPRLSHGVAFPYLAVLVSGGHCQILIAHAHDRFERLGGTIDDAPGEAFDKIAKLLGLGFPGGPALEHCARTGDATRFDLPRPLMDRPGFDLSFSGLKTAVRLQFDRLVAVQGGLSLQDRADLCASFQAAVADVLARRSDQAMAEFARRLPDVAKVVVVAGGVAANTLLRHQLTSCAAARGFDFVAPPLALCGDNAAMIAWAGAERLAAGEYDGLDFAARPRWPLDLAAAPMLGYGQKGAKA